MQNCEIIKVPFLIINLTKLDLDKSKFWTGTDQNSTELRMMQAQKCEDYGINCYKTTKHFVTM